MDTVMGRGVTEKGETHAPLLKEVEIPIDEASYCVTHIPRPRRGHI